MFTVTSVSLTAGKLSLFFSPSTVIFCFCEMSGGSSLSILKLLCTTDFYFFKGYFNHNLLSKEIMTYQAYEICLLYSSALKLKNTVPTHAACLTGNLFPYMTDTLFIKKKTHQLCIAVLPM